MTEQMTTDELAKEIAAQLRDNITEVEIREWATAKGCTREQVNTALDGAHTLVQEEAGRDPLIRLILGPALLLIAFVGFYTDWAGRSVGFGSVFGLIALLPGSRLVISLLKQWARPKKITTRQEST